MHWLEDPLAVVPLMITNKVFFFPLVCTGICKFSVSYSSQIWPNLGHWPDSVLDKAEQQSWGFSGFPKAIATWTSPPGLPTSCRDSVKEYVVKCTANVSFHPQVFPPTVCIKKREKIMYWEEAERGGKRDQKSWVKKCFLDILSSDRNLPGDGILYFVRCDS